VLHIHNKKIKNNEQARVMSYVRDHIAKHDTTSIDLNSLGDKFAMVDSSKGFGHKKSKGAVGAKRPAWKSSRKNSLTVMEEELGIFGLFCCRAFCSG
jgi:hypothetical protein